MVMAPEAAPADAGLNDTVKVTLKPAPMVIGVGSPV